MLNHQMPLIPVDTREMTDAAVQLALLLQQVEEEDASWDEAKEAHKETMAALRKAIADKRQVVLRWRHEQTEGLTRRQVDALLDEATEREG